MHAKLQLKNLYHLEDLGTDGRIILKSIFEKHNVKE
jgi:hypothetical protein